MDCPTCGDVMKFLAKNGRDDNFFLCPRCGTVFMDAWGQHGDKVYVPKLVERCRAFEADALITGTAALFRHFWSKLGIGESINTPENRS